MSSPVSSRRWFLFGEDALEGFVAGGVVGGAGLPAVPDDVQPGAGEGGDGVGVVFAAGDGVVIQPAGPGLAWRESPAKSQTASRSCLSAAQRKPTWVTLPDWRVEGATPARQISASGVGNRARQSPISASS